MSRGRRWLVLGGAALTVMVAAPFLARMVPFFDVRRVELVGVRYLDPHGVLDRLALAPDQNLFDPLGDAEDRVRAMAGVVDVMLDRDLPGTLRVRVVERMPAALVSGADGMIPLDCRGRPLPYDPAGAGLDLPVVARVDSGLVRALCLVRTADSALYQDVEVARRAGDGAVTLELGQQRVLLRSVPTTDEILAVGAVRRHLQAEAREADELDARFAGWVVARRART